MTPPRLALDDLNTMGEAEFAAALGGIVEHAPAVAAEAARARPFATVEALHAALFDVVRRMPVDAQLALIRNHPELAGREAAAGELTAESVSEQGSAGFDRLSPERARRLAELNAAYRDRFGVPFLVCVRRHTVRSVLAEAERRLAGSPEEERAEALRQMFLITRLRIVDRVAGPGQPATTGRLTTHVLDTVAGRPAEGVRIELHDVTDGREGVLMRSVVTNADGRLDEPLIAGQPLRIGAYEILFGMAEYFTRRGYPLPGTPYLADIPIRFGIAEPEAHYHVPLTATPWSYSTYRGS